jgi:HEAT repeat protein
MWILNVFRKLFGRKKRPQEAAGPKDSEQTADVAKATAPSARLSDLDTQLRSGSHAVRIAAAEKLAEAGEEGALILMQALKEGDNETYEAAVWGIEVPLIKQSRGGMGKERLRQLLRPATEYLIEIVRRAQVLKGAAAYDLRVHRAAGVLGALGDPEALPALEELIGKVQRKIEAQGNVRERAGFRWISTEDSLLHLRRQVDHIKGNQAAQT